MPSAVRALIEARLCDLSEDDRRLLDVGAVLGYEFRPDLVARVKGLSRVEVLERMASMERRHGSCG